MSSSARIAGLALVVLTAFAVGTSGAAAQESVNDAQFRTVVDFPNSLSFYLIASAPVTIDHAEVHYTVDQISCSSGIATGIAEFSPTSQLEISWKWDLRETGGIPVGARINYQWVFSGGGRTFETPETTIVFEDPRFHWRTIESEHTRLHWYAGSESFAQELLEVADAGIEQLRASTGVLPSKPVEVRIFEDAQAMRDGIIFGQDWAGGISYPTYGLVDIGVNNSNLDWGRRAMVHEMTHVIVGETAFSCGAGVPGWLTEGLAMYNEGPVEAPMRNILTNAVTNNSAFAVRSLAGSFPADRNGAILSYSQSQSIIDYLLSTFGPSQMNQLLTSFAATGAIDRSLINVYGFDSNGLDQRWRTWVGLPERAPQTVPSVVPLPTMPPLGLPLSPTPNPEIQQVEAEAMPIGRTPTPLPTHTPATSSGGGGCNRSEGGASGLNASVAGTLALFATLSIRRRKRK
jgi:hypothetical protein